MREQQATTNMNTALLLELLLLLQTLNQYRWSQMRERERRPEAEFKRRCASAERLVEMERECGDFWHNLWPKMTNQTDEHSAGFSATPPVIQAGGD